MARFVGKTFESLNSMLNNSGLFLNNQDKGSSKVLPWTIDSKSFIRKLKNKDITKQDEEDITKTYLTNIQKRLSEPDVPNAEVGEMIKVCMTCENMGYPTQFIYVHCLKLAQKGNLQEKHTGYLGADFFLHPQHELVILLINTMQKDLCSSNYMEVLLALSSVCNLINVETVQNVLHLVEDQLNHANSSVRKSAILTLGHCLHLTNSQSAYQMSIPKLEKALTDNELEVVAAAACTIYKIIQKVPCDFTYLIPSLVELQDQVLSRRVPPHMIYCDIPAPWLQLDILKLFNLLCKQPEQYKEVIPILLKTLQQVGLQMNLSHAILYQVIEAVTYVEPCNDLVEMVLTSISMFLKSKSINLKLIGVESLVSVAKRLKPSITVAQQEIIMECLKLPDETLQLKTLELLFYLANPSNVQAICKKLMEFLVTSKTSDKKKKVAMKILQLALLFIDKQEWFIQISTSVLIEAGQVLSPPDIYNVINTISKDATLEEIAKSKCLEMCRNGQQFSPSLLKLAASVSLSISELEEFLPIMLSEADEEATNWFLVSLMEVILNQKEVSSNFIAFLKRLEIKYEYSSQVLNQVLHIIELISNLKGFDSNEQVDPSLTFLDSFVIQSLESNGSYYLPSSFRLSNKAIDENNFEPNSFASSEVLFPQVSANSSPQKSITYSEFSSPSTSFQSLSGDKDMQLPALPKSKSIWTEEGRNRVKSVEESLTSSDRAKPRDKDETIDDLKDLFAGIS